MIEPVAFAGVLLAGLYFVALGLGSLLVPDRANRFLLGFAGSASRHYTEMAARLTVGAALVLHAPRMPFAAAFALFGWALVATTAVLLLVPWHWHRRFAQRVVPRATRYILPIGLVSLAMGGAILAAAALGPG